MLAFVDNLSPSNSAKKVTDQTRSRGERSCSQQRCAGSFVYPLNDDAAEVNLEF